MRTTLLYAVLTLSAGTFVASLPLEPGTIEARVAAPDVINEDALALEARGDDKKSGFHQAGSSSGATHGDSLPAPLAGYTKITGSTPNALGSSQSKIPLSGGNGGVKTSITKIPLSGGDDSNGGIKTSITKAPEIGSNKKPTK
jgi:hypothetical protein